MAEELLLEIGTEEIPAAFMPGILSSFKELMEKEFSAGRIGFTEIKTFGTPRRLILMATGVAEKQEDLAFTKMGPAKNIAYDADGNPTKAAIGFARGQGIDVADLVIAKTDKGEYISVEKKETGVETSELLPEMLKKVINAIPCPKAMRWSDLDVRFVRPVHWIVSLFSGKKISFSIGNIESGDETRGHRFMAPAAIKVTGISSYLKEIKKAYVIIDPDERKKIIQQKITELAIEAGGVPDADEGLLNEVSQILESPFPVLCRFDDEYLKLPKEVILTPMKKHQKYFPVLDKDGNPLSAFIAVNNTDTKDPKVVINGHERVLRARLADAEFFYVEDQKKTLIKMAEELKNVLFQAKLGTSYEKVMRFQALGLFIADLLGLDGRKEMIERASFLCKADLVSEMVGEFASLQGVMGREYARLSGEPEEVSQAIFEHYLPRFAEDELPSSDTGAVVSLADKLDTIVGCFSIGLIPTGTADPYALRRQCLGIINIVLDKKYVLSLKESIEKSISLIGDKAERSAKEITEDVLGFFRGRLSNLFTSRGFSHDVVESILSLGMDDIADIAGRVDALQQMKKEADFEPLAIAFKRVVNIITGKASENMDPDVIPDKALFEQQEENKLFDKYVEIKDQVNDLMAQKSYVQALKIIASIRETVDSFFDNVLVMAEDRKVMQNRLALLRGVNSLFTGFADFTKISSE